MSLIILIPGIIVGVALAFCETSFRLSFSNHLGRKQAELSDYSKDPLTVHEYRKKIKEAEIPKE